MEKNLRLRKCVLIPILWLSVAWQLWLARNVAILGIGGFRNQGYLVGVLTMRESDYLVVYFRVSFVVKPQLGWSLQWSVFLRVQGNTGRTLPSTAIWSLGLSYKRPAGLVGT